LGKRGKEVRTYDSDNQKREPGNYKGDWRTPFLKGPEGIEGSTVMYRTLKKKNGFFGSSTPRGKVTDPVVRAAGSWRVIFRKKKETLAQDERIGQKKLR